MHKVILPELGQGIEKATVSFWFFQEGESVQEKTDLVELTTDKAAFNLSCPCSGKLSQIIVHEGETAKVGDVLAEIEENQS